MTTRPLLVCLCWLPLALAAPTMASSAAPEAAAAGTTTAAQRAQRYGPYATMRRANEVANWFRQQGYQAVAFHNGDAYYVDVR